MLVFPYNGFMDGSVKLGGLMDGKIILLLRGMNGWKDGW